MGILSLVDNALGSVARDTFFRHPQIPFSMAILAAFVLLLSGVMAGIIPGLACFTSEGHRCDTRRIKGSGNKIEIIEN